MYRKKQFTVYKQLTRFMKRMIYCTGWRPTVQSSWHVPNSNKAGLPGFQCVCDWTVSVQNTSSQKSHVKTKKTSKESHDCTTHNNNSTSGPNRNIYSRGRFSRNRFMCCVFLLYITSSVCTAGDSHGLMNSKQMLKRDQQVSMIFVQPSRFSLHNQPLQIKTTKHLQVF